MDDGLERVVERKKCGDWILMTLGEAIGRNFWGRWGHGNGKWSLWKRQVKVVLHYLSDKEAGDLFYG